ncbi:MAG TPA: ABC transporter family substrate-binding protein [Candidatus Corynebacterium gallistercoris]|uniref:ABC transporter family substrate-binding protein n=1 Tax=Candidatus Corynebacterium gallistercoris TaxID=2838530 RepID=A0A9D1S1S7_9CORY|nr:ABC transporter family substrate-binding protein [Candidatus Corynebacterium gallistercoris]
MVLGLAACQANPGDAPTVDNPTATSTSQTAQPEPKAEELREITVGVDAFTANLNPHVVGNLNPVVAAIADLTLPSVYVPGAQGLVVDGNFVTNVVTDDELAPTQVTYTLNPAAQWSDGTPITISDFQYLVEAISAEPTAAEMGVYSHVKSVEEANKANSFTVTFDEPFAAYKELFKHLLPSHIYRGEGQNFGSIMIENSAASAGAYTVRSVDAGRGVVELQRNDRYWGEQPARTDIIRFTTIPNDPTGAQMLRTEQIQAYLTRPQATTQLTLEQLENVQLRSMTREVQLNLVLNQASEAMADREDRLKYLRAIDAHVVAHIVAESDTVEFPSWNAVAEGVGEGTTTVASPNSEVEPLVIGAPTDDPDAVVAARTISDQLVRAGYPARVRTAEPADLFGELLQSGEVDAVATWQASPNSVADYAEQFRCGHVSSPSGAAATGASATPSVGVAGETGVASPKNMAPTGGNLGAVCDQQIEEDITDLTTGAATLAELRGRLDQAIANEATVLPILNDDSIVAVRDVLAGPAKKLDEWPVDDTSGIFVSAPTWSLRFKPGEDDDAEDVVEDERTSGAVTSTATTTEEGQPR